MRSTFEKCAIKVAGNTEALEEVQRCSYLII